MDPYNIMANKMRELESIYLLELKRSCSPLGDIKQI